MIPSNKNVNKKGRGLDNGIFTLQNKKQMLKRKNLFEETAVKQQKEELVRIKILSRIKGGNLKGAYKLARPYLEELSRQGQEGRPTPLGWVRISQTLCAYDMKSHGISRTNKGDIFPSASTWVGTAYEIACERLKGAIKALVPASMAIALIAQALQPIPLKAQNPTALGTTPDKLEICLDDITSGGKIQINAVSSLQKDSEVTQPELEWKIVEQGEGKRIKDHGGKLIGSLSMAEASNSQKIKWSTGSISYNSEREKIEIILEAENISRDTVGIKHFSVMDSVYEGCTIKVSKDAYLGYNEHRSPSELKPQNLAKYKISTMEGVDPIIMFRTQDGETHSLILKVPSIENIRGASESISWVVYKGINNSYQDVSISIDKPDNVLIKKISIENKSGVVTKNWNDKIILHPGNKITLDTEYAIKERPPLILQTSSRDSQRSYELQSSNSTGMGEKLEQIYKKLMSKLLNNDYDYVDWSEVEYPHSKEQSQLIEANVANSGEIKSILSYTANNELEENLKLEEPEKIKDHRKNLNNKYDMEI
jgi:hypothetical protein